MPIKSFLVMALACALQTFCLTVAFQTQQVLWVLIWSFFLGRNLLRAYILQQLARQLFNPKK